MSETTINRHRCHSPACGRLFGVVCRRSLLDVPIPMAVACPHCGYWDVVLLPTGGVKEFEGTYVLPLDYRIAALET